jgi:hypothetical protein
MGQHPPAASGGLRPAHESELHRRSVLDMNTSTSISVIVDFDSGNKKDNITIIYTPWSNLKKDGSMAAGQVTFHNHKLVRKVYVKQRENSIVNRLNKTRVEKYPDLRAEKEEDTKKKQRSDRKLRDEQRAKEKKKQQEYEQLKWQKDHAYDDMFTEENMEVSNNQDRDEDFLDDFM